ncbi:MAG: glycosyltransferase family 4 protein, partial [Candidatus Binatia bacterium]
VTLFASGDSATRARLEAVCATALRLDPSCVDPLAPHVRMLGRVFEHAGEFDIIHCHTDYLALPLTRFVDTPTLITLHGRLDIAEIAPLYADYPEVPLVSISDAQRIHLPGANFVATVPHGLPAEDYRFRSARGSYLLFLGRISPEKRPDSAIRIATAAGVPLRIAAKVDRVDRDYFETTIRPLLHHPLVEFIGEVGDEEKRELLGGALALLFPIDWPEPFGLVMIEALACGTPVIARRRGSAPEVLRHGVTAWIGETDEQLVVGVARAAELDRNACRAEFELRFTAAGMARRYVEVYEEIRSRRRPTIVTPAGPEKSVRAGSAATSAHAAPDPLPSSQA